MPPLLLALRLTATTALTGLTMGCVALPDHPYDDNDYGQYPHVPDAMGGDSAAYSTHPVNEPPPRYVYSSPGGIPLPRSAPAPRPVWQRGNAHLANDWR